jgi:hypothetical protein
MVRLEEPADAVMVTDVALVACQLSVTLCPLLMEFVLAEKVTVGAASDFELPHEAEPYIAANKAPHEIQRNARFFMQRCLVSPVKRCGNQMQCC